MPTIMKNRRRMGLRTTERLWNHFGQDESVIRLMRRTLRRPEGRVQPYPDWMKFTNESSNRDAGTAALASVQGPEPLQVSRAVEESPLSWRRRRFSMVTTELSWSL